MDISLLQKLLENTHASEHDTFCCCMCEKFLISYNMLSCEHLFCKSCILSLTNISHDMIECPIDGKQNFKHMIKEGSSVKKLMQLDLDCLYTKSGCRYKGKLTDIQQHIAQCQFIGVVCPQGCQQSVPKKYLSKHLELECSHKCKKCEHCQQNIICTEMEDHKKECCFFPVHCPNDCGNDKIPRQQLKNHLSHCTSNIFSCKYEMLGCSFKGSKKKVTYHEENLDHHMNILMQYNLNETCNFDKHLSTMQAQIAELQNENLMLKDKVDQNNEYLEVIKCHVMILSEKLLQTKKILKNERLLNVKGEKQNFLNYINEEEEENVLPLEDKIDAIVEDVKDLRKQIENKSLHQNGHTLMEQQYHMMNRYFMVYSEKFEILSETSHDGTLIWKINNLNYHMFNAVSKQMVYLDSPPFYTSHYGYKMFLRIFLNGDGNGKGTHVSLYIAIMKSPYDAILSWPFQGKITLILLDQVTGNNHIKNSFRPDQSSAWQQPVDLINETKGFPQFVSLTELTSSMFYVINDTIFIKAIVAT